jgi:hypothetical protein
MVLNFDLRSVDKNSISKKLGGIGSICTIDSALDRAGLPAAGRGICKKRISMKGPQFFQNWLLGQSSHKQYTKEEYPNPDAHEETPR